MNLPEIIAECLEPAAAFFAPTKILESKVTFSGSQVSALVPRPRAPCSPAPQEYTSPLSGI
jgi:hypothetical protein